MMILAAVLVSIFLSSTPLLAAAVNVTLNWNDTNGPPQATNAEEEGTRIYREIGGVFQQVGERGVDVTEYSEVLLANEGDQLRYHVRPFRAAELAPPSNEWVGIVQAAPPIGQSVASFTLINADNDQDIGQLTNGQTITTANVNVRANTSPATVGSVRFLLNGSEYRLENGAPYALGGDSGGNYDPINFVPGSYSLQAIPYTASDGGGTAGTSLTVNFTVTDGGGQLSAPSNLSGQGLSRSQIRLNWSDNSNDETGFQIEQVREANGATVILNAGANATQFTSTGLSRNNLYHYRVRAVRGSAVSAWSSRISVMTTR